MVWQAGPEVAAEMSGRKPGGQRGHEGGTLRQVADPDEVARHQPGCCRGCGRGLTEAPEAGLTRRQVFDLPPVSTRVTEHQLVSSRCGMKHRAAQAMSELFGTPVSAGTVAAATAYAARDLAGFSRALADKIAAAEVAH